MRELWTKAEDEILHKHFTSGGLTLCAQLLPGRTYKAISNRAKKVLKLESSRPAPRDKITVDDWKGLMATLPDDTRDITARIFGDPIPGRSALDMKHG